jgi:lactoylglutathione lyase
MERLASFYATYFQARVGPLYHNPKTGFRSRFLTFPSGARLELMEVGSLSRPERAPLVPAVGYAHIAFSVGSAAEVDGLTERLRGDGYAVVDGPRRTGDGYYESKVLDPAGNLIEITV